VAIIGAGPAGLAAATDLRLAGHDVTIFEARGASGGMLSQAIPDDRLPADVVRREVTEIEQLGAEIRCGQTITDLDALFNDGFAAVVLAIGLWSSSRLQLEGSDLDGVQGALDFLTSSKEPASDPPSVGKRVIVIGGGSVAMDAARVAYALGAKQVEIASLESPHEMPGTREEIGHAWETGVIFHSRVRPLRYTGTAGRIDGADFVRIEWRQPGQFTPDNAVDRAGTEFHLPTDTVIEAIGQRPDDAAQCLLKGLDLEHGRLVVDRETMMTSRKGVFAAGDILIDGGTTVVRSVYEGKHAAAAIDAYLTSSSPTGRQ
jgi:glutamate synthase (NADPH/NADH) small chain